jgi:hypothetical protein
VLRSWPGSSPKRRILEHKSSRLLWRIQGESAKLPCVDEGRKRVISIIAGIIMARNLDRAYDLFGRPQGSPRTDKMIAAAVQWAERIMARIDSLEKQRAAQN